MGRNPDAAASSPSGGLPVAPSLGPTLRDVRLPSSRPTVDARLLWICALAMGLGACAAFIAELLSHAIHLVTNLAFFGRLSIAPTQPHEAQVGLWVIAIPVLGGVIVGLMARYGSRAIRGHGIPEAMEQVLTNESRIPPKLTFLKPLSSAIAIGTGGPFGAEGPIIATGGALGSWLGQLLPVSAHERKTLLASGAAAGMAATFGSPVAAVLLAIELLLFELRPRSFVPVALATCVATALRVALLGEGPAFAIPAMASVPPVGIAGYVVEGALMGLVAAAVTRAVYAIEDGFEKLPIHWMWWPALGGVAVGVCGFFMPRTLGVGYANIEFLLAGTWAPGFVAMLCLVKFISWSLALGSGTSGGTLAPLFTIGGALGSLFGTGAVLLLPSLGVEPRMAAMVGMASIFAGSSRALLTSVVFAFETTRQSTALLPLLAGCTAAYTVTSLVQKNSIMTEKIVRRGIRVIAEYDTDTLARVNAVVAATREVVTLGAADLLSATRAWLAGQAAGSTHQAWPIVDAGGRVLGVLSRRDLLQSGAGDETTLRELVVRPLVAVYEDQPLRDVADRMTSEQVGRVPVLSRQTGLLVGIITRSDLLRAHGRHRHSA